MNYFFKTLGISLISTVIGMFLLALLLGSGVAAMPLLLFGIIFGAIPMTINAIILTILDKENKKHEKLL